MVPKIVQFQTVIPRHHLSPPSTLIHSNENLKNNALLQDVDAEETERQKRTILYKNTLLQGVNNLLILHQINRDKSFSVVQKQTSNNCDKNSSKKCW